MLIATVCSQNPPFKPSFDPSQISELADRYNFQEDAVALRAGTQIRNGKYTRTNLLAIFEWKTKGRGRARLEKNTDLEKADALTRPLSPYRHAFQ
jgi:hypothetical protein